MWRRSRRSARRPTGHCTTAAPTIAAVMKLATPPADNPLRSAKTGASDQNVPLAEPDTSAPTTPTGEIRNSQESRNRGTGGASGGSARVCARGSTDSASAAATIENGTNEEGLM